MNCIFCSVFNQEKYVDMFFLLLESILIYGNLDENTNILVYTSTLFMDMIKKSHLFNNEKVKFEINDTYNNFDKACKARLDLFNLSSIKNYNKILYLDTDILVKDDINKVFDVCNEDILYVLEEGEINSDTNFWGTSLFENEVNNYDDKTAFTSGILLFNHCEKIKDLFDKINEDMVERPYDFICYDQPYIVYNAFKYNLYNNKILKTLVVNNDNNIHSDKVIHHFPEGPGIYQHKINAMTIFLNSMKEYYLTLTIPKVLFQTNRDNQEEYVLNMIKHMLTSEWKYEFYNDADVIKFFIDNPISDLPEIIQKYNSIKRGSHRADLFRYYYLYINGGFFMDSDAMLYVNIDTIVKDYNFISVNSSCNPGCIFQGILGASPKNKIIKRALYKAYNTNPNILDDYYHYFCKQLYDIIKDTNYGYNIKLYDERRINYDNGDDILDGDTLLFKHYWKHKVIPKNEYLICFDTKYGKIFLNKNDKYFVDVFSKNEYWDDKQLCILKDKYIPNDKNILEIGAHSGTSTIFYSTILKENNIIYAFEPQKQMFTILNKNVKINNLDSKIKTFNSAIFCKTGQINMHSEDVDGPSKGNISKLQSENKEINYGGICLGKNGELTSCIKLDDLDFENIGYIRCDAQGAEPFIFSAATQFIKNHRPVILYEDINLYGNYLFNIIISSYPEFISNSKFDIKKYCIEELGYYCISNFNNSGFDSLLLPYLHTDWNNYNKTELNEFDYTVLNTYKIPNNLVRVGPREDGGYVIADGFNYDLFISCGIANDIRFEESFLDIHKIKCFAFDGTIQSFPYYRNSIEWIPKNIGYLNTEKTTNLKEYIQNNNKIFLKMDIEGSEFNWLDSMTEMELEKFSQIVLEVHWPFDIYRMNMLKKLNTTHYIIHIHGNNYCDRDIPKHLPSGRTYDGTVTINNHKMPQIKLPEVFEVTYINKKLCDYSSVEMKEFQFPTILDYPNNPNANDIYFSIPINWKL
jgi:FkbM family methyltransferase